LGVSVSPALTPLALNPAPVTVTALIVTLEFPLFVKVTFCEPLLPSPTFPKLKLVGLAPSSCVAATPVPLSPMESGEFGPLFTSEMVPVTLPTDVGAKTALNVALAPAAIVRGVVKPVMLKLEPETVA
jgi:hypothetical protein